VRVDEHLERDCWCTHSPDEHHWDALRDYRELICLACRGERSQPWRVEFMAE
jgi:hypothetical protein